MLSLPGFTDLFITHHPLHIQARSSTNVPFNHLLASLHLQKQNRIANDTRRILNLSTRLIQPRNDPHNRSLHNIRQISDAIEAHAPRPFIHNLHHTKSGLTDKIIRIVR